MATITVNLQALTGTFETDFKRAAKTAEREMKAIQDAAAQVGTYIAAGLTAAATALTVLTKSSIDAADHMRDLSIKAGISVESMSALGYAAAKSGSDVDALTSGLVKLAKNAADAAAGGKENAQVFSAIGVAVRDAQGNMKGTDELFSDVAEQFRKYKDGPEEIALAIKLFGKSGADLIQTLNSGKVGLEEFKAKAKELGIVLTGPLADAADEFNDTLDDIKRQVGGLGNVIAQALLPYLQSAASNMSEFIKSADAKTAIEGTIVVVKNLAVAFDFVKNAIEDVVILFAASIETLTAVGSAWMSASGGLINAAQAVNAATHLQFESADEFAAKAKAGFAGIGDAAKTVKAAWSTAVDSIAENDKDFKKFSESMTGTFSNVVAGASSMSKATADAAKDTGTLTVPIGALAGAADKAKTSMDELANAEKAALDMLDTLRGGTDANAAAQAEFDKGMRELRQRMEDWAIKGGDVTTILGLWQEGEDLLRAKLDKTNESLAKQGDVLGSYLDEVAKSTLLSRMSEREKAVAVAVDKVTAEWNKNTAAGFKNKQSLSELVKGVRAAESAFFDLSKADEIVTSLDSNPYKEQLDAIKKLQNAIDVVGDKTSEAFDPKRLKGYEEAQARINMQIKGMQLQAAAESIATGLSSLQSLAKEGSAAYNQMQVAIDAANLAAAIGAIMNQGMGDPYTAFARMAAMAVLVAKFVGSVRAVSGGFSDSSAHRQATQGTGSVLGDSEAKSESIARATEITANATQQLVGLNRGMLTALQALQNALSSAGGMLARGAGEADFSGMKLATKPFDFKDPLTNMIFGGSSKITDQGIVIMGGALNDMLNHIAVGAYQEVKSKSWAFGSTKTKTGVKDVSSEFEKQFGLVMQSIADTVSQGAKTLGLLPADIEAAMAAFKVEEVKISLKGLSAEDQQKAIEAVFSKIFDDLAGSIVPFIDQFQKVGEGLGETLVRIATEVQVAQEAFKQLGLAVNETDPEKFAQISDSLVQASGGLDAFISGMQSFVANFSTSEHQFQVAADALNSAFEQAGLTVPATRDGMWQLMKSLDATTESGREQIATLLRLADVSNQYYDMLEKQAEAANKYAEMVMDLDQQLSAAGGGFTDFQKALADIVAQQTETIASLNAAARAAGLQGAREEDLAKVHQLAAARAAEAARQLEMQSRDLVAQLYGSGSDSLSSAANYAGSALSSVADGLGSVASAAQQFRDSMLLDSQLSPLNTQQQFAEAMSQLQKTGDEGTARRALELARSLMASGADYKAAFDQITGLVRAQPGDIGGHASGAYSSASSAQAQLSPAERADLAQQLAHNVADLSGFGDKTYEEVAAGLGLDLTRLGADLGLQGQALTDYLDSIKADSYGIDDLSGVIARQVDRIVEAILHGTDTGGSIAMQGVLDGKATPETSSSIPQVNVAAGGFQPASNEALQSTNNKLDALLVKLDKVIEVGVANVKATAGTSDDVIEALHDVRASVDDVRREVGSSAGEGNFRMRNAAR